MVANDAQPKYVNLADLLEVLIHKGALGGRMPSVRAIADEHHVSLVTATRAVRALRERGLVRSLERSGSYVVRPSEASERWALCLRLTPGPFQHATAEVARAGFQKLEARGRRVFITDRFRFRDGLETAEWSAQVRAAAEAGVSGVFFMPSRRDDRLARQDERFLSACRAERMPVVLLERNQRRAARALEWDLVCGDDLDGGKALTRHLLGLGRTRIAFVTGSPTSSHDDRMAGYAYALIEARRSGLLTAQAAEPYVVVEPTHVSSRAAYRWLVDRLLEFRADGVVCFGDYTAVGVIVEVLRRGLTVPRDLAVAGFDNLPIGDTFAIGVTSYASVPEDLATRAIQVMRLRVENPGAAPVKVVVPGRLIVRESTRGSVGSTGDLE